MTTTSIVSGAPGKFTSRMAAAVLGGQALCVWLGGVLARSIAITNDDSGPTTRLVAGLALGVLCIVAAVGLRRGWGLTMGWIVQVLTLASAFVLPLMLWIGLLFAAVWVGTLVKGRQIDRMIAEREDAAR